MCGNIAYLWKTILKEVVLPHPEGSRKETLSIINFERETFKNLVFRVVLGNIFKFYSAHNPYFLFVDIFKLPLSIIISSKAQNARTEAPPPEESPYSCNWKIRVLMVSFPGSLRSKDIVSSYNAGMKTRKKETMRNGLKMGIHIILKTYQLFSPATWAALINVWSTWETPSFMIR